MPEEQPRGSKPLKPQAKAAASSRAKAAASRKEKAREASVLSTAPEADPAPAALQPSPVDSADVLALYRAGDVEDALQLALSGQLKPLAMKLSEYQGALAAGQEALHERNTARAIQHLATAVRVDQELSQGEAAHTTKLHKQLGRLYTQLGQEQLKQGAREAARESFQLALQYDPANPWARVELQALGTDK